MIMGEMIKTYRHKYDLSLTAVAKEMEVSKPTLSRIENGGVPSFDVFLKIMIWMATNIAENPPVRGGK
jgi:transcriptional regulator with XRE-family HTH domain